MSLMQVEYNLVSLANDLTNISNDCYYVENVIKSSNDYTITKVISPANTLSFNIRKALPLIKIVYNETVNELEIILRDMKLDLKELIETTPKILKVCETIVKDSNDIYNLALLDDKWEGFLVYKTTVENTIKPFITDINKYMILCERVKNKCILYNRQLREAK